MRVATDIHIVRFPHGTAVRMSKSLLNEMEKDWTIRLTGSTMGAYLTTFYYIAEER